MPDAADLSCGNGGQTDEGGVSAESERESLVPELDVPAGHQIGDPEEGTDDKDVVVQRWKLLKKHAISMPTIFLPEEMQKAVDSVISCEQYRSYT